MAALPTQAHATPFPGQLDRDQGMPNSAVRAVRRTDDGFTWFGTWAGLVRYDGTELRTYVPEEELGSQVVSAIEPDGDCLWIGTIDGAGLYRFDPTTETFEAFPIADEAGIVVTVHRHGDALWVGTWGGGLWRLPLAPDHRSIDRGGIERIPLRPLRVTALHHDQQGRLWVLSNRHGLCRFSSRMSECVHVAGLPDSGSQWGQNLIVDEGDHLWVVMRGAVYRVPLDGTPRRIDAPDNTPTLFGMVRDSYGQFWVFSLNDGTPSLFRFDPASFSFEATDFREAIYALEATSDGMLWIGTKFAGVVPRSASPSAFASYTEPLALRTVAPDTRKPGSFWALGTEGLVHLNPERQGFEAHALPDSMLPASRWNTLFSSPEGSLWLSSHDGQGTGGLGRFDPATGEGEVISLGQLQDMADGATRDSLGRLWVGTEVGLLRIDAEGEQRLFLPDPTQPGAPSNSVLNPMVARDGLIWTGSYYGGVTAFDEAGHVQKRFRQGGDGGLRSDTVFFVQEDHRGNIWFGTSRGCDVFRPGSGIVHLDVDGRRSAGSVKGLAVHGDEMWVAFDRILARGTVRGLSPLGRFEAPRDLRISHGGVAASGDWIVALTESGVEYAHMGGASPARGPEQTLVADIFVDHSVLHPGDGLEQASWRTDALHLPYDRNLVSLRLSAIGYGVDALRYRYRLDDAPWLSVEQSQRYLTFGPLAPGRYEFEAIAEGQGSEGRPTHLTVVIEPPWWERGWARMLFVLLVCAAIAWFIRARLERSRERSRARAELIRSERLLRSVLASTDEAIFGLDLESRCIFANRASTTLVGAAGIEGLLGKTVGELLRFGEETLSLCPVQQALAGEHCAPVEPATLELPSGTSVTVLVRTCPMVDHAGQVTGCVLSLVDITERVAAEDRLRAAEKLELVGKVASGVAHDMNNALNVAHMTLEGVEGQAPGDVGDAIGDARRAISAASGLSTRLLGVALDRPHHPERIEVAPFLQETGSWIRRCLDGTEISFAVDVQGQGDVMADRRQLASALLNLVLNAKQAMGEHGSIVLRGSFGSDGSAILEVRDNGPGIPPELHRSLFEPFVSTKLGTGGSGLGLYMVKRFATQSGGRVSLESDPESGTTISLHLPAVRPVTPVPMDTSPRRVLVLDDYPGAARSLLALLRRLGCTGVAVEEPEEAFECFRQERFDIVFSDYELGASQSGVQVLEEMLIERPEMYAVLITGSISRISVTENIRLIRKPIGRDTLEAVLRDAEHLRRARERQRGNVAV